MWSAWKTATAVAESAAAAALLAVAVLPLLACTPAATTLPPQTVTQAAPSEEAEPPQPPPEALPRPPQPPPTRVIEIEPVEPEPAEEPSLVEAARRERERRARAEQPAIVITDANLKQHATGLLTFTEEEQEEAGAEGDDPTPGEAAGDAEAAEVRDEAYWRARVRALRQSWHDAVAQLPELERRVADLRERFYAADDAYYRDSRIKPAWDRAIDLVAQTQGEAEAHRLELERVLEEGRRAGALPGWLREGIELEPPPPEPEPEEHEPGEPQVIDVDGGGRR